MNRCLHLPDCPRPTVLRQFFARSFHCGPDRTKALLLGLLVILTNLMPEPANAQDLVRQFPPAARRGTLEVTAPPNVLINGQAERLSPGARIKNTNNTLALSGSLVGQRLLVNYLPLSLPLQERCPWANVSGTNAAKPPLAQRAGLQ